MSLGHKQLEENPWEVFESVFAVGSKHQATVTKVEGGHATVALPYGLEGTCHSKHLTKQDGTTLGVDGTDEFVVLEFNRNAKRITVSHLRTYEEGPAKSDAPKKPRSSGGGGGSTRMMDEVNSSVEKSTFGDLGVLTALKEQMDGGDAPATEEAPAEKKKAAPKKKAAAKKAEATEDAGEEKKEEKKAAKKPAAKKATKKKEDAPAEDEAAADEGKE